MQKASIIDKQIIFEQDWVHICIEKDQQSESVCFAFPDSVGDLILEGSTCSISWINEHKYGDIKELNLVQSDGGWNGTWTIDQMVTAVSGAVRFQIAARSKDGNIVWQTNYAKIYCDVKLPVAEQIEKQYPSVLEQMRGDIGKLKEQVDSVSAIASKKIEFQTELFEPHGKQYLYRLRQGEHGLGTCVRVKDLMRKDGNDYRNIWYQARCLTNGDIAILSVECFDGFIIVENC